MIEFKLEDRHREAAKRLSEPLTKLYSDNEDSILSGGGFYISKLGEIAVAETFGWEYTDTYENDFEGWWFDGTPRRIEVKTKRRTVPPKDWYNGSVAAANAGQRCDYYLFCSSLVDKYIYIIGYMPKDKFIEKAFFARKGEQETPSWCFQADCYNLPYNAMYPLNSPKHFVKGNGHL